MITCLVKNQENQALNEKAGLTAINTDITHMLKLWERDFQATARKSI